MRITNLSTSTIYLRDLKLMYPSRILGEDRYLGPGASAYILNTSEVIRSCERGDLARWLRAGVVSLEDTVHLAINGQSGDTATLVHGYNLPPCVYVLKEVTGKGWVDATGTVDIVHEQTFTETYVTNTLSVPQTLFIRLFY